MKNMILFGSLLLIILASCKKDELPADNTDTIYVNDNITLSNNLYIEGSERKTGSIPAPSSNNYGVNLNLPITQFDLDDDSAFDLEVESDNTAKVVYIQIDGTNEFFEIIIDENGNFVNKLASSTASIAVCCSPNCPGPVQGRPLQASNFSTTATVQVYEPPITAGVPDMSFLWDNNLWSEPQVINLNCFGNTDDISCNGATTFTDLRDGQVYNIVKIGNQCWFAENLNYETAEGSWCYDNNSINCDTYGRLYDWYTALNACPEGWELPEVTDYENLKTFLDNKSGSGDSGDQIKSVLAWPVEQFSTPNNSSGFTALPGGWRDDNQSSASFIAIGASGQWWTQTTDNLYVQRANKMALLPDDNDMNVLVSSGKSQAHSCRCIQTDNSTFFSTHIFWIDQQYDCYLPIDIYVDGDSIGKIQQVSSNMPDCGSYSLTAVEVTIQTGQSGDPNYPTQVPFSVQGQNYSTSGYLQYNPLQPECTSVELVPFPC